MHANHRVVLGRSILVPRRAPPWAQAWSPEPWGMDPKALHQSAAIRVESP